MRDYTNGLVEKGSNSIANAQEILQSSFAPLICMRQVQPSHPITGFRFRMFTLQYNRQFKILLLKTERIYKHVEAWTEL